MISYSSALSQTPHQPKLQHHGHAGPRCAYLPPSFRQ